MPQPAYSPDLSPCDSYIKACLQGHHFESPHTLGSMLFQCLNSIPQDAFRRAFLDWIEKLEKCVQVKGEYFAGLEVIFTEVRHTCEKHDHAMYFLNAPRIILSVQSK